MDLQDLCTAKEAAIEIGINYQLLMARIRKGKIKTVKKGWAVFIPRKEVEKQKRIQAKRSGNVIARKGVGRAAR